MNGCGVSKTGESKVLACRAEGREQERGPGGYEQAPPLPTGTAGGNFFELFVGCFLVLTECSFAAIETDCEAPFGPFFPPLFQALIKAGRPSRLKAGAVADSIGGDHSAPCEGRAEKGSGVHRLGPFTWQTRAGGIRGIPSIDPLDAESRFSCSMPRDSAQFISPIYADEMACAQRSTPMKVPTEGHRPPLRPPQFGILALFLGVALIALYLALWRTLGPTIGWASLLVGASILMHILGNALGTRLRDGSSADLRAGAGVSLSPPELSRPELSPSDFAPISRLGHSYRLGRPLFVVSGMGGLVGAVLGTWGLSRVHPGPERIANLVLAFCSCGVLAGLWTFWVTSFLTVFVRAVAEAHKGK